MGSSSHQRIEQLTTAEFIKTIHDHVRQEHADLHRLISSWGRLHLNESRRRTTGQGNLENALLGLSVFGHFNPESTKALPSPFVTTGSNSA